MAYERHVERKVEGVVRSVFKGIFIGILIVAVLFLVAYLFMLLWNWLMPDLFGLGTLTYWKAFGLLILAKIVFGFGGGGHDKKGGKHRSRKKQWKERGARFSRWNCDEAGKDSWEHYDRFWSEEGEKAFEAYVEKIKAQESNEDN
ncbi:hypothetical protein SAMN04490243_0936 [Robiginitalea myxolifaciens]|uniref:Uncharacterized protein n=1 Tax=Robiginitalea myxolifaciens TaxID=400055 RepID=A0A1I6FYT1_9FLAO|nr:hypothetical protein [Robiginitalea myxolifaciens]SFR35093.1 hypothetical protein SAMN04490243_0936 [Robiginitalea myxolifaciens]